MKTFSFLFLALLASVAPARAQMIVIGPNTLLQWDVPATPPAPPVTVATAQGCTYAVSQVQTGPFLPVIGAVTCSAPVAPAVDPVCSVNLMAQTMITVGSGSVYMTTTCSGQTSLPSLPFAYVDMVVPIPKNVRFK